MDEQKEQKEQMIECERGIAEGWGGWYWHAGQDLLAFETEKQLQDSMKKTRTG